MRKIIKKFDKRFHVTQIANLGVFLPQVLCESQVHEMIPVPVKDARALGNLDKQALVGLAKPFGKLNKKAIWDDPQSQLNVW